VFTDYPENSKFVSDSELTLIREGVFTSSEDRGVRATTIRKKNHDEFQTSWRYILLDPAILSNNIGYFIQGFTSNFVSNWLPKYYMKTFHLSESEVGTALIVPWIVIGLMITSSGYISDRVMERTNNSRIARTYLNIAYFMLSSLFLLAVIFSNEFYSSLCFLTLSNGFIYMSQPVFYGMNFDLVKDRSGASLGVMHILLSISGIVSPLITGIFLNRFGTFAYIFYLFSNPKTGRCAIHKAKICISFATNRNQP
jgi:predicted MFS family arabinose efflux permease